MPARSPTTGPNSATIHATFTNKTHVFLGRQTSHCEETKKTTHLYFTFHNEKPHVISYVFRLQTS